MTLFKRNLALIALLACVHSVSSYKKQGDGEKKIDFFNLINWDDLKTFQDAYSALPEEIQDKLNNDFLRNPGQIGKNLMSMFGPQVESLITKNLNNLNLGSLANLASVFLNQQLEQQKRQRLIEEDNEIDVEMEDEEEEPKSVALKKKKKSNVAGFDFGPFGTLLGNMVTNNPHMLIDIFQSVTKVNLDGLHGISVDSIFAMFTQQMDLDRVISILTSISDAGRHSKAGSNFADMLKLQEILQWIREFSKSTTGKKVNRMLPRVLKAESLPDALRIIEKEMINFRFDTILRQIQNPIMRQLIVVQAVRPIGEFLRGIHLPVSELKEIINDADELLNDKMGLGEKTRAFIEPVMEVLRGKFKISKESLLDLKPKDFEKMAGDILSKEVLEPMAFVWDVYGNSKNHPECAPFVFCQLNKNFYDENFIRRYVIRTSSTVSAFQASATMTDKDAFSKLHQAIRHGADGYDCTHGITSFCLDLMDTAAHNEL